MAKTTETVKLPAKTPLKGVPDLLSYDWLMASISGGKDSQGCLDVTVKQALAAGVPRERIVAVFADLGKDDEWEGTEELAAEHAAHYGIRFIVVRAQDKNGNSYTLSEHIEARGMWPSSTARYCTSDMKRGPIGRVMTQLCRELRAQGIATDRKVRILNVMGLRAQESPKRAKMHPFTRDNRASNQTVKEVHEWLPIHGRDVAWVWFQIKLAGTRSHWAYDAGMPRLSCKFCVLASRSALVRAAQLDPKGVDDRIAMEDRMGHTVWNGTSFRDIRAEAEAATARAADVKVGGWAA